MNLVFGIELIEDGDVLGSAVHDGAYDDGGGHDGEDDDGVEIDLKQGVLKIGWAGGSGAPA